MPAEIRIYFEGDKLLKPGFEAFLRELRERARNKRCGFRMISSKSGEEARQDFETALEENRSAWSILLRDSEGPLRRNIAVPHAGRVFWMVEMMGAWFHAAPSALAEFYGARFQKSALKAVPNVERIAKKDLEKRLGAATSKTAKGNYFRNKTTHGPQLLALIDLTLVRKAAPNCERLFQAVRQHLT
jgi:Domain of unknown function (DUF4276)